MSNVKEIPNSSDSDPKKLLDWLIENIETGSGDTSEVNWHGLADSAALRANSSIRIGAHNEALQWARISIISYQHLIGRVEWHYAHALNMSMMMLRVKLIKLLGPKTNDLVLDIDQIYKWFFDNLHVSIEDAVEKSNSWITRVQLQQLEPEEIVKLRYIKNRLSVFKEIQNDPRFTLSDALKKWMMIKPMLP